MDIVNIRKINTVLMPDWKNFSANSGSQTTNFVMLLFLFTAAIFQYSLQKYNKWLEKLFYHQALTAFYCLEQY